MNSGESDAMAQSQTNAPSRDAADRRLARHRPRDGQAFLLGGVARHHLFASSFPGEDCPWMAGPQDHLQIDLADPDDTRRAIAEVRERLKEDGSMRWSTTPRFPQGAQAARGWACSRPNSTIG